MELAHYWWTFVLRGVLAIACAGIGILIPGAAIVALIFLFGVYAAITGAVSIVTAISGRGGEYPTWALWLHGAIGLGAAVIAFAWPGLTAVVLLYVVAGWALLTGVLELIAAVHMRRVLVGEWRLALAGTVSIAFAALVFVAPVVGALAAWALTVAYVLIFGVILIALGLEARRQSRPTRLNAVSRDESGCPAEFERGATCAGRLLRPRRRPPAKRDLTFVSSIHQHPNLRERSLL